MENHHFEWEIPLEIAIFNSYVKLPEGKPHTSTEQMIPVMLGLWQHWVF